MSSTFGKWMRQQRKALDLTQEELARRVNCAVVTIQKIEEGQRRPSKQLVELLAQELEIPKDEMGSFVQMGRAEAEKLTLQDASHHAQLPTLLSSFVGREQEIQTIREYLLSAPCRLLTLTGPPGVGKTRLAIQAADTLRTEFADGVFFISLATSCNADLVIPELARSLGFAQAGPGSILKRLQHGLSGRDLLLVLDNFEQVVEAAPQIAELLVACPSLKLLVTSRLPLKISGEQLVLVEPLPIADYPHPSLETYASAALFLARVQSFQPGFRLTAQNAPAIQEICSRLDGLPLAIELAAARLRVLSPTELAQQLRDLERPVGLLGDGRRDLPARHQFLHNAIQWSYSLLDDTSQQLFRQAAVFAGSFDLQALAAVARLSEAENLIPLLEHNLVRREGDDFQGLARFSMLETIRSFALERLAEVDEYDATRQHHSNYYLSQAQAGGERPGWLDWCEMEHDNLRAALQWLAGRGDGLAALQLCLSLEGFWEMRGYHREARVWLDTILPMAGNAPLHLQIQMLMHRSIFAWQLGDFSTARQMCQQALAMCLGAVPNRPATEPATAGVPIPVEGMESLFTILQTNLARIEIEQGEYAQAQIAAQQALDFCTARQDTNGMCAALLHLGEAALAQRDLPAAQAYLEQAWELTNRESPDFWGLLILHNRGELALENGELAQTWQFLSQALELGVKIGHNRPLTLVLAFLAGWLACHPTSTHELQLQAVRIWAAVWAQRNRSGLAFAWAHRQRVEAWQAQTQALLGEQAWQAAWEQGVELSVEQAVQLLQSLPQEGAGRE